jgi:hypothetical protein
MKVSTGARIASMSRQILELNHQLANWHKHADDARTANQNIRIALQGVRDDLINEAGSVSLIVLRIDSILGGVTRMFTQQHYKAVAKLIKDERERTNLKYPMGDLGNNTEYTVAYAAAMQAIAELQLAFMKHFKLDNVKFEELLFIGACGDTHE